MALAIQKYLSGLAQKQKEESTCIKTEMAAQ
jgi:hypothetical protein